MILFFSNRFGERPAAYTDGETYSNKITRGGMVGAVTALDDTAVRYAMTLKIYTCFVALESFLELYTKNRTYKMESRSRREGML